MNTDDINLAYKVRHALNEQLDTLPASTTDRLAAARAAALARKKPEESFLQVKTAGSGWRQALAGFGSFVSAPAMSRLAVAAPVLALVIGMGGMYQHNQQQQIAELADIDAAVLSDELPLTAYLDPGFPAYLESQQRRQ